MPAHKWADLSETGYGVSLLNDCKYGYDIKGNQLRLTLLKGPVFPDPEADRGNHTFTYSLYPHNYDYSRGGTVQAGYNLNQELLVIYQGQEGNKRPEENKGQGGNGEQRASQEKFPEQASFFNLDADNVILETIKKAEDEQGYILRCDEAHGSRRHVRLESALQLARVSETNLLEEEQVEVLIQDKKSFTFQIKPYEIKTFRVIF